MGWLKLANCRTRKWRNNNKYVILLGSLAVSAEQAYYRFLSCFYVTILWTNNWWWWRNRWKCRQNDLRRNYRHYQDAPTGLDRWTTAAFPVVVWHSGSALVSINEVNLRRARLVLAWVTVSGFNFHLSRYVTSHPGHLSLAIPSWVGAMSTSQRAVTPYGWGSKGRYGLCVGGRQDCVIPLLHAGHVWALSRYSLLYEKALYKIHVTLLYFRTWNSRCSYIRSGKLHQKFITVVHAV